MNDRQDPYAHDPYAQQPQVYGYDAYGQPVYQPNAPERVYDQYGQALAQQYGHDGHEYGQQHGQQYGQDGGYGAGATGAQGQQQGYGHDPYGATGQQSYDAYPAAQPQTRQQEWIPRQAGAPVHEEPAHRAPEQEPVPMPEPRRAPDASEAPAAPDYRTEQFSFIEEPDEDSEDVIDWLKFSESRTERRDERKRKGRNRVVALVVAAVLALGGGLGYLLLGGSDAKKGTTASGGGQKRDVIVVHLRQTKGGLSSTALLVDNETTKKGTTVLLPNALAVSREGGGSTTLGKSVQDEGTGATRDALNALLGADIKGSWRLDTPYLENLVDLVGGIVVDTDVTVPGAKSGDRPLVRQGKAQDLSGQMAVGYATHRAPGESPDKQLVRFGQVMRAVLKKMPDDPGPATTTVDSLAQIPDPSLSVKELGASLAQLAKQAKNGSYDTAVLPVQKDGTLSAQATDSVVKDVLGGTVRNTDPDATPRVSVKNATGGKTAGQSAQVTLVNSGYTHVDAGTAPAAAASTVTYADDKRAAEAKEVAKTLGLPAGAVKKAAGAPNADITVTLGKDYKG
ncbi:LytR C-terminal domain-containing protein [Streptomyces sp. QH1-20]|uniref:LCP family protein n=1 Tax=Streptomyces sp. QH1-20 TaxID=3240934 RepID=UPI003511263B